MSAPRNFVVEIDDKIKREAVALNLKRYVDPMTRVEDAGYLRGLHAAKELYEEIGKHNNRKDED